ncbi:MULTISPECIES: tRNA adenosine(34) deaminase TadA [Gammaproteobacteria]|uniref:tRNA adenosine(34) deaminase TadA n=1 Tax=Gammaproteobacteria TaxID=1236 RepID=UPI000DD0E615|nr:MULTISPECIES: tRNA adenosine(34) deaminase TadA [Gammaproteobacteria]RTE86185.1 tRNA adenosine(34) deaminase TadA [Aliidiomarina sp. B3213]TCZ91537.1 tRNA adenosine(34) deaminase TadA [Lysobacter sp. N42]
MTELDQAFMQEALAEAQKAEAIGEVPVGAVVVHRGEVIARGHNQVITQLDPSAHAEMIALREAAKVIGNYRIEDTTLYVTLEPCPMCAGLLVHSRISRLVFGAYDLKTGSAGSLMNLVKHDALNHQVEVESGVLEDECATILSDFFKHRRAQKKRLRQLSQHTQDLDKPE